MTMISVENLTAFYENREIFHDLNFSVESGDYLCIIGENGSGKTTLMRCLLGLPVKHSGTIEYYGFSNREIGWLPQRIDAKKDFPASVREVVFSGLSGKSVFGFGYNKFQKQKALKNMELLEIKSIAERSFQELSGGQQQKVLLCRAMCAAGRVLLLDEPVTGLDSASKDEMYRLIRRLNDNGITVIMISHDIDRALNDANKVLYLSDNGSFFGTVSEYFSELPFGEESGEN